MAFEGLSEKLQGVFKNLKGKGSLTEADIDSAMREVKLALLEADVNFKVVKEFVADVKEKSMVMMPEPVFRSLRAVGAEKKKIIYMSPKGRILDQTKIEELSHVEDIVILCGHYEGIDQRILDGWDIEEISIGDYILTGGEPAAIVLVDTVARMLPGVLGDSDGVMEESIYSGLLEYPQYTKPREFEGMAVPEVLLNGNHELIRLWNFEQALIITRERRPDLFSAFLEKADGLSRAEKKIVEKVQSLV